MRFERINLIIRKCCLTFPHFINSLIVRQDDDPAFWLLIIQIDALVS
jgi:hypothetical protein